MHPPAASRGRQKSTLPSQLQSLGNAGKPLVAAPEGRSGGQPGGHQQVGIDIADAESSQRVLVDERQHFGIGGETCVRQPLKRREDCLALAQEAECQLPDDKRTRP